jgi:hypothetical protein
MSHDIPLEVRKNINKFLSEIQGLDLTDPRTLGIMKNKLFIHCDTRVVITGFNDEGAVALDYIPNKQITKH